MLKNILFLRIFLVFKNIIIKRMSVVCLIFSPTVFDNVTQFLRSSHFRALVFQLFNFEILPKIHVITFLRFYFWYDGLVCISQIPKIEWNGGSSRVSHIIFHLHIWSCLNNGLSTVSSNLSRCQANIISLGRSTCNITSTGTHFILHFIQKRKANENDLWQK